jgi:hypothetical protein
MLAIPGCPTETTVYTSLHVRQWISGNKRCATWCYSTTLQKEKYLIWRGKWKNNKEKGEEEDNKEGKQTVSAWCLGTNSDIHSLSPSIQMAATGNTVVQCQLWLLDCCWWLHPVAHCHPNSATRVRQITQQPRTDFCMFLHFTEVLLRNITCHTWTIILFLFVLTPSPSCHEARPINDGLCIQLLYATVRTSNCTASWQSNVRVKLSM